MIFFIIWLIGIVINILLFLMKFSIVNAISKNIAWEPGTTSVFWPIAYVMIIMALFINGIDLLNKFINKRY